MNPGLSCPGDTFNRAPEPIVRIHKDMEQEDTIRKIDVYVFYFDVVGFVDQFLSDGQDALTRLRQFQRRARNKFEFGGAQSYVVTLYDNIWARVNATEHGVLSLLLNFAGHVMHAANAEGFGSYFGSITRGIHDFDLDDRTLVGGNSFEDLRVQHIDMTSEPHIRAAYAEKWSRDCSELRKNCVWVSSDAVESRTLPDQCAYPDSSARPFGEEFDLANLVLKNGRKWPFPSSRFRAIRAKGKGHED